MLETQIQPGEPTLNQVATLGGLTDFAERRTRANTRFFALEAERLARLCRSVAEPVLLNEKELDEVKQRYKTYGRQDALKA